MMQCPRCTYPLSELKHADSELDHCRRCGGSFLAPGEATGIYGAYAEPSTWKDLELTTYLGPSKLPCPKGHGRLEAYNVSWANDFVEVDVCSTCRGLWLDAHEGEKLYRIARNASTMKAFEEAELARINNDDESDENVQEPGIGTYIFQLFTGFPIEVWNPVRKRAHLVISLVLILSTLFVLELLATNNFQNNAIGFFKQWGVIPQDAIKGVGLAGFFTHMFLHAGLLHLLGNLYFLYIFGDNVEDVLGKTKFALLYILAGFAGALLHVLFTAQPAMPMIGASGAIAGLMGAYLILFPKVKVWVVFFFIRFKLSVGWYFLIWVGFQLLIPLTSGGGVAWLAHMGGFFIGMLLGFLFRPKQTTSPQPHY